MGLGGNIGDVFTVIGNVLKRLASHADIFDLKSSKIYQTTPVSDLPQPLYLNAVCSFKTAMSAKELLKVLQAIEKDFGKVEKPKNEPRTIDLDILFFGEESIKDHELEIPHPRWQERLFVLVPLLDLTTKISFLEKDISLMLKEFKNRHNEKVKEYKCIRFL